MGTRRISEIVGGLAPASVTIRTLDVGGDKPLPGDPQLIGPEANPFMGFRAIRMCLENPGLFKNQLRAILRASAHGKVELMFPMISGADELARARAMLEEAKAGDIPLDETLALGDGANDLAMIEAAGLGVAYHAKPIVAAQADARIEHTDLTTLLYFQGYNEDAFVTD